MAESSDWETVPRDHRFPGGEYRARCVALKYTPEAFPRRFVAYASSFDRWQARQEACRRALIKCQRSLIYEFGDCVLQEEEFPFPGGDPNPDPDGPFPYP